MSPLTNPENRIDPFARKALGSSELMAPQLGFGAGTLGDPTEIISADQAYGTLSAAYESGIRYFDTAPWYGLTKSERRVGDFLKRQKRASFAVNTKVGRVFREQDEVAAFLKDRWKGGLPYAFDFDYTRSGFQQSFEDSLRRLGLGSVDALAVHDLDLKFHKTETGVANRLDELEAGGGFQWLLDRKQAGDIKAIGAGVNEAAMIKRFVERFEGWDYFLVAMPYTLLDQPALDEAFSLCEERGISVIIGSVFASGILATGPKESAIYAYRPAELAAIEKTRRIEEICNRYAVPLGAAALQFPLWHKVVDSVIPGGNSPGIVQTNLDWLQTSIPVDLWGELKASGLIRKDAPTP